MRFFVRMLLASGAVSTGCAVPVLGAGVFCDDLVLSGKAAGDTRRAAEAAAVSWWSSRAGAMGRGYEHWENARDTEVVCEESPQQGKFTCIAKGRPCLPEGQSRENVPKLEL